VIYAPATWLERMKFWFGGVGMSTDVWGASDATVVSRFLAKVIILGDNLGPAGAVVALAALVYFALARVEISGKHTPWPRAALLLPLVGFAAALVKIGYAPDYFAHPVSLALVPVVTVALARFLAAPRGRVAWRYGLLGLAVGVNFYYAQIAWILPYQSPEVLIEQDVAALPRDRAFNIFSLYPGPPHTRLEALGYAQDLRPAAALVADGESKLPEYLYQSDEDARWLADFPNRPERAAMVLSETKFDYARFPGLEAWHYVEQRALTPALPGWYPFGFMPISRGSSVVRVYRRVP